MWVIAFSSWVSIQKRIDFSGEEKSREFGQTAAGEAKEPMNDIEVTVIASYSDLKSFQIEHGKITRNLFMMA